MKVKYELKSNDTVIEIPDELFDGIETEEEINGIICDCISEHFLENFTYETQFSSKSKF